MRKTLEINLIDPSMDDNMLEYGYTPKLYKEECQHIINNADENADLDQVLNDLISIISKRRLCSIIIDIDGRNKQLAPAKEMTIEEIEKKLGHKIKIVRGDGK